MRKILFSAFLSLMLFLSIIPFASANTSEPTGHLFGEPVKRGSSLVNQIGSDIYFLTDGIGGEATLRAEATNTSIADYIYYNFSSEVSVNAYKIKLKNYSNQTLTLRLYDSSGEIIYGDEFSAFPGDDGIYYLPQTFTGVKTVALHGGNADVVVFAWDVYSINQTLVATKDTNTINLSWNPVWGATSYTVQRSLVSGGPYTTIAASVTDVVYSDTSVQPGIRYYYIVIPEIENETYIKSNEATAMIDNLPEPELFGRGLLTIYISGGQIKEYDLSAVELSAFLNWYDAKDSGSGPAKYAFTKTWNKGPFKTRTEYVIFDKILTFDVDEYEVENP